MLRWPDAIYTVVILTIILWQLEPYLGKAANIAQILSIIGLIVIYLEIQKSRKELERQKEGLSMNIDRVGTISLLNKLPNSIKIIEVKQKRTFLKSSEIPTNNSDANAKPEFTDDMMGARVLQHMGIFQDRDGVIYKEFKKALITKLQELRKQKTKKDGEKVSEDFLPVPISWGDKCVLPDSLTYGLRVQDHLCIFVQTWIIYQIDPTQEWNTIEVS